jgi:hypothetical protein
MDREYQRGKQVTEDRLYIETMEELLKGVETYIVSSDIKITGYDIHVFDRSLVGGAGIENQP